MKHKLNEEKWDAVMDFFAKIFKEPARLDSLPDKTLLLSLSDAEITKIFTKERLSLIKTINQKHPRTISELSRIVERNLVAVERDLGILEEYGIVKLEKKGKEVMPIIGKKALILPLQTKPFTIEQMEEQKMAA